MYEEIHPLFQLDQLLGGVLHEDWQSDYDDPWQAAEVYVMGTSRPYLDHLLVGVRYLFKSFPDSVGRYDVLANVRDVFVRDEFDAWLQDLERRLERALAGDNGEPMVAPE